MPRQRVRVVHLDIAALRALADGDLVAANAAAPVPLTAAFIAPDFRRVWEMRAHQVVDDPSSAAWITGVVWDEEGGFAVGRAGFHGPPDADGMVEIGYEVVPEHRRRGYARAAFEALLDRADRHADVRTVRVTIAPANTASRDLVLPYGFVEVGEQWDDEDGLEIIYERPTR